jgi:toxin ParE1/3/4
VKRYRISREAADDLDSIFIFWAERSSLTIAQGIIEKIVSRFWLIAEHPEAGRVASNIAPRIRCFPAGNYLIYYRNSTRTTDILHIFHGKRDQRKAWVSRKT